MSARRVTHVIVTPTAASLMVGETLLLSVEVVPFGAPPHVT